MMDYLQSFSIRDFLIFSPDSYFKLFELSNQALWPIHIVIALLAMAAVFFSLKQKENTWRLIFAWLGLIWIFVGYWYFKLHYSQISTYAHILSYIFWFEAFLLLLIAFYGKNNSVTEQFNWRFYLGGSLILYGLILHPIIAKLWWKQNVFGMEFFSIAPDPTAIATIGFLVFLPAKGAFMVLIIPCLWLLFSFMTIQAF